MNIVIQKEENTKRTLKVFTTLMETTKHLPAQKKATGVDNKNAYIVGSGLALH